MRIKEGYLLKKMDNRYVIMSMGNTRDKNICLFKLNDVGAFIWEHLTDECTEEQLYDLLLSEYDVEPQVIEKDVCHFLNTLREHHLITE